MELILETVETMSHDPPYTSGSTAMEMPCAPALEEHAVHVPDILELLPGAEGGMYPGYLRNYGEAGFPRSTTVRNPA